MSGIRSFAQRMLAPPGSAADVMMQCVSIVGLNQLAGLLIFDFGHDSSGQPLQVSLINALMLQMPLYACGLFVPMALWAIANATFPRRQRAIGLVGIMFATALVVVSQIDFGMQRFRGERVSLAQLVTYLSPNAMNSDWIGPALEQPVVLFISFLVFVVSLSMLFRQLWRARSAVSDAPRAAARTAMLYAVASVACYLPTQFAYQPQRDLALSPQAVLIAPLLFPHRAWSTSQELEARTRFRDALDVGARTEWLSDSFPLWRVGAHNQTPSFGAARADPPDIVLFMVESLRGHDVGWGFGRRPGVMPSVTPHLDSLARLAVTFPHYIANGDPSPRGFITLHSGSWEHEHDFIIANHPDIALDGLPLRLATAGYRTTGLWGGNPSFDNQLTWARRWYNDVVFDLPGNSLFYFRTTPDHVLMDRTIAAIDQHDQTRTAQPFFMMIASAGTHTPFTLESNAEVAADTPTSKDRQRRYDLVLRNLDAGIGRVVAKLRTRARWKNTVIIVVGDHSDRTNEVVDARWRGMPTDAAVGTAALIFGPRQLIGEARVLSFPASHVDVLPTILAWLGDTTPVTTLGRDLFDTTAVTQREAVAVNGRGYRLDRGGFTLLVDRDNPHNFFTWRSFASETPIPLPLLETPFRQDEPERLTERIRFWSHLVDENRVRPSMRE